MYRTIQTDMWSDPELEEWSFEEKAFYIYLITSPHTTMAGFVKKAIRHMAVDTGLSPERVQELLETLVERGKIVVTPRWVWIKNFLKYQSASSKVWEGIIAELINILSPETLPIIEYIMNVYDEIKQTSKTDELIEHIKTLKETLPANSSDTSDTLSIPYPYPIDTLSIPYRYPIDTLSIPYGETETVTETETVLSTLSTIARSSKKQEERVSTQSVDAPSSESDSCKNLQEDLPLRDSPEDSSNTTEKIDVPSPNRTPYQKIIEIYHEECPDLPRVKVLNETRKRFLRARWREHPDLEWWREYFQRVHKSDFLCGRVESRNGGPPFRADFEWLIRPNNMAKVIEGRYDNRDPSDAYIREIAREMGIQLKEG